MTEPEQGDAPVHRPCLRLAGHPIAGGRVTGRALVVGSRNEAAAATHEIVVVLSELSPALAPWFAHAAGIVVERGGPLSNGATLAREAGVPAVLLEAARSVLHTGDLVTVDGDRGTIDVCRSR
jgi:rifampicin phosphotransferase